MKPKMHGIRRFPSWTFAVQIGDHLRLNLGIIGGAVQVSIQRSKINLGHNFSEDVHPQLSVLDTTYETVYTYSFPRVVFGAKHSILAETSFHSCAKEIFG